MIASLSARLAPARLALLALLAATALSPAFAQTATSETATPETGTPGEADFRNAGSDAGNWILPAKNYANNPWTPDTEIGRGNVGKLRLAWRHEEKDGPIMAMPLVWHETMFLSTAGGTVIALDAANGKPKWRTPLAEAGAGRLALFDGNVYLATEKGALIALDPENGHKKWEAAAATEAGFRTAPVPYHNPASGLDMLLIGTGATSAGESGAIAAFAARDGKPLWLWRAIPGPGAAGHESWGGSSSRQGAVAPVGIALSPGTHTVFVTFGSPAPVYDGDARPGNNLYSDSLVALDLATPEPKLRGYHQFIAHDVWDWGPATAPLLFFGQIGDKERNLIAVGDKGGNLWILDGDSGALLDHAALSFVKNGATHAPGGAAVICPAIDGGIQSFGAAFNAANDTLFLASADQCAAVSSGKAGSDVRVLGPGAGIFNAVSVASGTFLWRRHFEFSAQGAGAHGAGASFGVPQIGPRLEKPVNAGALATASGLVFTAEPGGNFVAFDGNTGQRLWHAETGAAITTPAIAYHAGRGEMIAVAAGGTMSAYTTR